LLQADNSAEIAIKRQCLRATRDPAPFTPESFGVEDGCLRRGDRRSYIAVRTRSHAMMGAFVAQKTADGVGHAHGGGARSGREEFSRISSGQAHSAPARDPRRLARDERRMALTLSRPLPHASAGCLVWRGRRAIAGNCKRIAARRREEAEPEGSPAKVPRRTPLSPSPKLGGSDAPHVWAAQVLGPIAVLRRADLRAANVHRSRSGHRRRLA
jgi:hypothetical protein